MLYTNPPFHGLRYTKRKISSDCICMSQEIRLTIYNYLMVDFPYHLVIVWSDSRIKYCYSLLFC